VETIFSATSFGGVSASEICDRFEDEDRQNVEALLAHLIRRGVILPDTSSISEPGTETNESIFYWHFGVSASSVLDRLRTKRLGILGVNRISHRLADSLKDSGFNHVLVFDHPDLRNLWFFDSDGTIRSDRWTLPQSTPKEWAGELHQLSLDCLLATSDFGSNSVLLKYNQYCIKHSLHFFPVSLHNFTGHVGPFVVPGETPCLNCLHARQDSNVADYQAHRIIEEASSQGQEVIGFHPAMASILADLAAFELTKIYSGVIPFRPGILVRVNLLKDEMNRIKLLKVPRCIECSPLNSTPSITITNMHQARERLNP
jgi:bacteriocin biosynthesis cyclodehydratase domain-containing protein